MTIEQRLFEAVKRAAGKPAAELDIRMDIPERSEQGDYATSIALQLAKPLKQPPIEIARIVAKKLEQDKDIKDILDRVEVAPPGFINIFLTDKWYSDEAEAIVKAGDKYGNAKPNKKQKVQVEFISANPTGPLTLANGRGGFLGDTIAHVLTAAGHNVTREYYVNDGGLQVEKLGWSVLKAAEYKVPFEDDDLYLGDYVKDLVKTLNVPKPAKQTDKELQKLAEHIAKEASQELLKGIKKSVKQAAGIKMDEWYSEKSLMRRGMVEETLKALKRKKLTEEKDGALWLKLSALKEEFEQDKVVVKSNGEPAYVLPDIAYHYDKFVVRKFDRVIDILGTDHQGHARVLTVALEALGLNTPEIILMQLVRLIEDGREVKMSKRKGTFVTLERLLDDVGVDVARWFFIERTPNTHMTFDLSLAKDTSEKNPVFYVQYAHARCSAILRKAEQLAAEDCRTTQIRLTPSQNHADLTQKDAEKERMQKGGGEKEVRIEHGSERELVKTLAQLPDLIERTAETLEVHHLTTYATNVAKAFSAFYRDCPVLSEDKDTTASRLGLVLATETVLKNTLGLMGVRAPDKM